MKKIICLVAGCTLVSLAYSQQNTPSAINAVSGVSSVAPLVKPYSAGTALNSVCIYQPKIRIDNKALIASKPVAEVNVATQYYDGLARPLQKVGKQSGGTGKDVVSFAVYDPYGKEQETYLPYAATTNDGSIKTNPTLEQKNYFISQPNYKNEQVYYGKTIYEPSPLGRPVKAFAPGNSWAGSEGSSAEHAVAMEYLLNTAAEDVRVWDIGYDANPANNIPATSSSYGDGTLYKNVTKDEHGKAVVEYKDREGQVILKKVQIGDNISADYSGQDNQWLCTYYVYDEFGRLRFVIPPKAVATFLVSGYSLSATMADELCFRYEYDHRGRMTAKKVPGAAWVYMLYDKRDRIVFTQDGNLRNKSQWMVNLYDEQNRPAQTGLMSYTGTKDNLQGYLDGITSGSSLQQTTGELANRLPERLNITNRETGRARYEASQEINFDDGFESETNAAYEAEIVTGGGAQPLYSQHYLSLYPIPATGANFVPLTLTHYDDYYGYDGIDWAHSSFDAAYNAEVSMANNSNEPLPTAKIMNIAGLSTGSHVRVLTSTDLTVLANAPWLETALFYDEKGRVAQVHSVNYKGGADIAATSFDFTSKPLATYSVHNNASGNVSNLGVKTEMTYDQGGRLTDIQKTIKENGVLKTTRLVAHLEYDEIGQLKHKDIGQQTDETTGQPIAGSKLEGQDYAYNIRGWLKGINWDYTPTTGSTLPHTDYQSDRWFGMDLSYDWGYQQNQYNGNIGGMRWQSAGDGAERSYGYGYDNANRLLFGDFKQNFGGGTSPNWSNSDPAGNFAIDFSMKMGDGITHSTAYDENGNILGMTQKGLKLNSSPEIDNLAYGYFANSNKLSSVTDNSATLDNKLGDFTDNNKSGNDYGYDVNGNMITDRNKDISGSTGIDQTTGGAIVYNHLNLPYLITVAGKGTIKYIYDATGNKLEKVTDEPASAANNNTPKNTVTTYLGGYVYENNVLQFFGQEEGRVRKKVTMVSGSPVTDYVFDYFLKDHLGNVRMALTDEHKSDFYPQATMESATIAIEEKVYDNLTNTQTPKSNIPGYPADNTTNPNDYVAKVSGAYGGRAIGPSITLKVMAGDHFNVKVSSWYKTNGIAPQNPISPLPDLILALANGISGAAATSVHNSVTAADIQNTGLLSTNAQQFLNNHANSTTKPKAFLNWILFDEHFKYVGSSSYFDPVPEETEYQHNTSSAHVYQHIKNDLPIDKNGYLYVYVSNETPNIPVYFDNLQVTHIHGPLTEETHYYPFGLTMAGISSKAAGGVENKRLYNEIEQNNDFDLKMYTAFYRNLDPQIGRFWQIDPKIEETERWSCYASMLDNPIKNIDPLGDRTIYYNSSGVELYRTDDKEKNAISVISDDKLKGFEWLQGALNKLGVNMNGSLVTSVMRSFGETYDIQGVFDFVDANAKNTNTRTDYWQPIDGKGPLINEAAAAVENKNGVWTVNPNKTDASPGSPFSASKQSSPVSLHTHDNEGRKFHDSYKGKNGRVESGQKSCGDDGDIPSSYNRPGTGLLEMAAGKQSIYFYNNSGVVIQINKDSFDSKNFQKK